MAAGKCDKTHKNKRDSAKSAPKLLAGVELDNFYLNLSEEISQHLTAQRKL